MEIGISTFVETTPDVHTGEVISHAQRLRDVVEEIVLADQVGLDVFGVGEHHVQQEQQPRRSADHDQVARRQQERP